MASPTRVLVYEYARHHRGQPVCASQIAAFFGVLEGAVRNELARLEELRAFDKDASGLEQSFTLREKQYLRRIRAIRELERGLPQFAAKLHGTRRLGPTTQKRLRSLRDFGLTDPIFK